MNEQTKAVIQQALDSFAGYRRELSDGQPCDAEKALRQLLEQQPEMDEDLYDLAVKADNGGQP